MKSALGILVAFSLVASSASAQCSKDTDCKGTRVCEKGECVEPATAAGACTRDVDCAGDDVCERGRCITETRLLLLCALEGPSSSVSPSSLVASDEGMRKAVAKIARLIGLRDIPDIFEGPVPNAAAAIYSGKRVIVYNRSFLQRIQTSSGTSDIYYSILAHELGHHLGGHTVSMSPEPRLLELSADYFSGFAMARLNKSLESAQAAMRAMGSIYGMEGSASHPGIEARLKEIRKGWKAAKNDETPTSDDDLGQVTRGGGQTPGTTLPPTAGSQAPYCCDGWGRKRCQLPAGSFPAGMCYCPFQGYGITCQ